jgi:hypothetical protein
MSSRLPQNGTAEFTVAASDTLAVFSLAPCVVLQRAGFPNFPESWSILQSVAANTEYTSAAFTNATQVRIVAGAAEVFYAAGVNAVITERRGLRGQPAPGVLDATGALTAAMMVSGIVTSAAAAVTGTLPTGTVLDAAVQMEIGESFDWSVIKVGANAFTLDPAAAHTVVGAVTIATATSAHLRTRKTAANTFVTYRLS